MTKSNENLVRKAASAAENHTIVALVTPPGRSGVAVVRLSGPHVLAALAALGVSTPTARRATRARLLHPTTGEAIDDGLVLYFPAPHSFTGEDVAELQIHGSRAVIRTLLDLLPALPSCRLAEPGEFSRRAFLNGKMDLVAAEGLADLIDAETAAQQKQALRLLGGETGKRFDALREQIIHALARVEAYIDFPDEEIPESVAQRMQNDVSALASAMRRLLDDGRIGEKIRDGFSVVILGAPNAGKSSLLNALARRDAAIVSPIAGTTRDVIEVDLELGGYAVRLIDTAGLRDSDDPIEQEGIRRARARAADADLSLLCFDSTAPLDPLTLEVQDERSLLLLTKADLPGPPLPLVNPIRLSARTGEGMEDVLHALRQRIESLGGQTESPLITRARHRDALLAALSHLERYSPALPIELQAEELRQAALQFAKITGTITVDTILDSVFSQFCIGK